MSMMSDEVDNHDDDDTTGQDRGDVVEDAGAGGAADDAANKGDDKGDDKEVVADDKGIGKKGTNTGDEEEEEEVEEEDEDEEEEEGGGEPDAKNLGIRLNKAKDQRDAARREAAEAKAQLAAALASKAAPKDAVDTPDPIQAINEKVDALYEQVEEARLDGDTKLAAKLQREIDASNREIGKLEAERTAFAVSKQTSEAHAFNSLLDKAEAAFPVLNPKDADNFDPKVVKQVEFYIAAHEKMGMNPVEALQATINLVFRDAVNDDATKTPKEDKAAKKAAELKAAGVKKAIDTGKKQPPDVSRRGVNTDDKALDPDALDDSDLEALPLSKKRALRGDFG